MIRLPVNSLELFSAKVELLFASLRAIERLCYRPLGYRSVHIWPKHTVALPRRRQHQVPANQEKSKEPTITIVQGTYLRTVQDANDIAFDVYGRTFGSQRLAMLTASQLGR